MKVAALQMVSGTAVEGNLRSARELLELAAEAGCELAVLPEYFCLLGRKDTNGVKRYGLEPFVAFYLTRAIPNAVWRRTESLITGGAGSSFSGKGFDVGN